MVPHAAVSLCLSAISFPPGKLLAYNTAFSFQFYGPRIGALYVRGLRELTPLHPMLFGGGQERNFRPG